LNQIRSFVIRSVRPQIEQSRGFPGVQFALDGLGMFLWAGRHQLERVASNAGGTGYLGESGRRAYSRATKRLDAHAARFPPTSF